MPLRIMDIVSHKNVQRRGFGPVFNPSFRPVRMDQEPNPKDLGLILQNMWTFNHKIPLMYLDLALSISPVQFLLFVIGLRM